MLAVLAILSTVPVRAQEPAKPASRSKATAIIANARKIVAPNGVERLEKVRIGGIDQWVSIRGADRRNPVLLYIHGGPGYVSIPMSWFVAGSKNLPAGNYIFELNRENKTVTLLSEDRSGNNAVLSANNSEWAPIPDKTCAIFQRYGAHYFLASVWREGVGQTLTPGKLERELASKHSNVEVARVEARLSPR
jgi:hypothetical protein